MHGEYELCTTSARELWPVWLAFSLLFGLGVLSVPRRGCAPPSQTAKDGLIGRKAIGGHVKDQEVGSN